uniref:Kinesin-like protein n=1 Tax=Culicoides sonorensis TaxID=179676 RepID=A0A336MYT3_CULSO
MFKKLVEKVRSTNSFKTMKMGGENVKVIVRCRPMNRKELDMKCKNVVHVKDCSVTLENASDLSAPSKMFTFDSAYDKDSNTESIYNDICYSLVESVLEGYNGTIFAYGQTGCGKSHTMTGPSEIFEKSTPELNAQRGIISRSFEHIFEAIAVSNDIRYLALVSYLEIYNETIRDLLAPSHHNGDSNNLQLKELPGEGVTVHNLSMHTVQNVRECEQLLIQGNKNRMVGATLMNAGSSRSHSIFTISVEQVAINDNNANAKGNIKKGKLNLVDLAGSERQTKTGATGDRLKEATKINLSLSALGNVISALVDGKTKHIPYRDSKLTRLLQDSLGGNTKTLMIACVSPAAYNYDETLSTLRYASRAKNISNKPRINEDPKDALVKEYQEEIMRLKQLLENNNKINDGNVPIVTQNELDHEWLEQEKAKLKAEFENETIRLKREHEAQKLEKQELQKDVEILKAHYEKQLELLSKKQDQNNNQPVSNEEIMHRIESIKATLIGGERANDLQLKEKRYKKKLAAQRKLSALAHALGRIEQSDDRDLLKEHYTDIHQELQAKTEALRAQRKKVMSLEREITDLQSEFQLDRADYLETIRKLECNQKFYEQMLEKAVPLLRKDGKFWDIDTIKSQSEWNDDTKRWRLPDEPFSKLCMLPAIEQKQPRFGRENTSLTAPGRLERSSSIISIISLHENDNENTLTEENDNPYHSESLFLKKIANQESENIVSTYFRPKRITELMQQSQHFTNTTGNQRLSNGLSQSINTLNRINSGMTGNELQKYSSTKIGMNKTWAGGSSIQNIVNKNHNKYIEDHNSLSSKVFRPTAAHRNAAKLN